MTRNEIIDEITTYVVNNELNNISLYSKEGINILLSYFEEKFNKIEEDNKLITFKTINNE